jgi:hypothetical protein
MNLPFVSHWTACCLALPNSVLRDVRHAPKTIGVHQALGDAVAPVGLEGGWIEGRHGEES